jgi:hypothetical protein
MIIHPITLKLARLDLNCHEPKVAKWQNRVSRACLQSFVISKKGLKLTSKFCSSDIHHKNSFKKTVSRKFCAVRNCKDKKNMPIKEI